MTFQFQWHPRVLLCGPSGVGKSHLLQTIAKHPSRYFDKPIEHIYYFHAKYSQPDLCRPWITLIEGPPDLSVIDIHDGGRTLIFLDDLGDYFLKSPGKELLSSIYSVLSRHKNFGVFTVIHSVFDHERSVRISSNYVILFNSYSDCLAPRNLISQLHGSGAKPVLDVYKKVMSSGGFPHLLFDNHTNSYSNEGIRIFSDIDQEHPSVFIDPSILYKESTNHAE